MDEETEYQQLIKARMAELPQPVQDAINSADVTKRLRELATTHQLHLDQWDVLENEVRMTLLGVKDSGDLAKNIQSEVGVRPEVAEALADDISRVVFEPIRQELERQLEHPDAQAKVETGVESMAAQALSDERQTEPADALDTEPIVAPEPVVAPVTASGPAPLVSPPSAPETKAVRAPLSDAYKTGEASSERKDVHNDPYREAPTP
jgi:hypothetical protein